MLKFKNSDRDPNPKKTGFRIGFGFQNFGFSGLNSGFDFRFSGLSDFQIRVWIRKIQNRIPNPNLKIRNFEIQIQSEKPGFFIRVRTPELR